MGNGKWIFLWTWVNNLKIKLKNITIVLSGLLLLWFAFDITGFSFKEIILVVSAIKDEPIDVLWWIIFAICFSLFIIKNKYGKYALLVFLVIWGFIQFPKWFTTDVNIIESYNIFFENEGTHYIIKPLKYRIIKDTYHIILDILIFLSIISNSLFIIMGKITVRIKNH